MRDMIPRVVEFKKLTLLTLKVYCNFFRILEEKFFYSLDFQELR